MFDFERSHNLYFFVSYISERPKLFTSMIKKIDILNYITNFRKAPNDIKTYAQIVEHIGAANEPIINQLLGELQQTRVLRETQLNGEKAYQVVTK